MEGIHKAIELGYSPVKVRTSWPQDRPQPWPVHLRCTPLPLTTSWPAPSSPAPTPHKGGEKTTDPWNLPTHGELGEGHKERDPGWRA